MTGGRLWLAVLLLVNVPVCAFSQATIRIVNADGLGEGFNDPTPATPVGGNPGTTVGEQRLNVFRFAANIWANTLTSGQVIRVLAFFDPMFCTEDSAELGGAAPLVQLTNPPGGRPNTWYPIALAEKLADFDFGPFLPPAFRFELFSIFNSDLGKPGCLEGGGWYYGLDASSPDGLSNLVTTVLHELGHGLGFVLGPTSGATGARSQGIPSIWETQLFDVTQNKLWIDMTDAERRASAVNTNNLVWTGGASLAAAPNVLGLRPEVAVLPPGSLTGVFEGQAASFGAPVTPTGVTEMLMPAIDTGGISRLDACEPLNAPSTVSVKGRIALIDRGTCDFTVKVKNAQNAGAIGVLIANNLPSGFPPVGGADPTVTIPVLGITQALGEDLREQLRFRGRTVSPVRVTIRRSSSIRAGTTAGLPRMYAPNPFQQASSISHWDTSLDPNQLMEPFDTGDATLSLRPPQDLTFPLLRDIGW
jgi:hypothetical protein